MKLTKRQAQVKAYIELYTYDSFAQGARHLGITRERFRQIVNVLKKKESIAHIEGLRTKEVAGLLNCRVPNISQYARSGRLPAAKVGKIWIFPLDIMSHLPKCPVCLTTLPKHKAVYCSTKCKGRAYYLRKKGRSKLCLMPKNG